MTRRTFCIIALVLIALPEAGWCSSQSTVESLLTGFENYAAESSSRLTLLIIIASATFISEDLACIAAGLLSARAIISPVEAVVASAMGIYIGDILLYMTGYLIGLQALKYRPLKWVVTEQRVQQCRILFEKRGLVLIFMSRFMPGTRTATFLAAGLVRVNLVKLLVVFGLAVLVWTPILVLSAMLIGKKVVGYIDVYSGWALWVFLGLMALIFGITRLIVPLFTWRGRKLMLSRWRRLSNWEFWPYYVTNVVTFFYVIYAGIFKFRNPTLFTITNPAIKPDSGFIGESKSGILKGLDQSYVGRWQLVAGATELQRRVELLKTFMAARTIDFPVVLKPDVGQRGQGVEICGNLDDAREWLEETERDYLMMEYIPGEEFGVFYYRLPDQPRGQIFSINRKTLLQVEGDGNSTLEELILKDDRALCLAPMFFKHLELQLLDIVPAGETRQLGQVGTHCLGALFLNGADLITAELLKGIEQIIKNYDGFYFGRFDLKTPSEEDLKAGRNLKVIELNGLTSEATHIYDPQNSIFYAWKTLIDQWSIAFRIAEANLKNGAQPMAAGEFISHWRRGGRNN
ncbi:MAG: VTT domain-containing protein [Desulfofustis sp.]|nr:VTT domain-containing protein [Desulfofustis sp.]